METATESTKPKQTTKSKIAAGIAIAATIVEFGADFAVGSGSKTTPLGISGDIAHLIAIVAFSVFGISYFWKQMGIAQQALLVIAAASYNVHAVLELFVNSTGTTGLDSIRSGSFAAGLFSLIALVVVSLAANRMAKKNSQ